MPARSQTTLSGTRNRLVLAAFWLVFYASFTLFVPPLMDDADSVHAEVAREMLVRHDWTTLYANGIRYLEKAPLMYWSEALSFRLFGVHTATARLPLAFAVLALVLVAESFARRAFSSTRAGLYAELILLSSFGIFIFTRLNIPDVGVCLWITLSLACFWQTEQEPDRKPTLWPCLGFALFSALNILTKGLIGIVFPVGIVVLYLLVTRGWRGAWRRMGQFHLLASTAVFLAVAVPWHVLIALANPTVGHPGNLSYSHGHWSVPLPTDGNVHGWLWFYFVNEQVLRYLNLRVPRDYDTVPLLLFWGLLLVWMMPWSAFLPGALAEVPWLAALRRHTLDSRQRTSLLLALWAAVPMLFFSFSTRQEYYVLPSLPALALLLAGWMERETAEPIAQPAPSRRRLATRLSLVLFLFGLLGAGAALFFAIVGRTPSPHADLADMLRQNPGDYALSFGHFLDLDTRAMGAFRLPLILTAIALLFGSAANLLLRRKGRIHGANLILATATFVFLLAADLGLQTFSPILTSYTLAEAIAPQLQPQDLVVIHGEYEAGSTLGFYLHRNNIHILEGRSSNLWYGSFFPDAPHIFETPRTIAAKWAGPQRVFLWQDLNNDPGPVPNLPGKVYVIARSGGKEILSNRPDGPSSQ